MPVVIAQVFECDGLIFLIAAEVREASAHFAHLGFLTYVAEVGEQNLNQRMVFVRNGLSALVAQCERLQ